MECFKITEQIFEKRFYNRVTMRLRSRLNRKTRGSETILKGGDNFQDKFLNLDLGDLDLLDKIFPR